MRNKTENVFIVIGIIFILCALCLTGYNIYVQYRAKSVTGRIERDVEKAIEQAIADRQSGEPDDLSSIYLDNPDILMPVVKIEESEYIGTLSIPKLKLNLPVMSQWSYDGLNKAPCRYSGSVYQNNLVIAGHNYFVHFGPISRLVSGDDVIFTDMDGNEFPFTVIDKETVNGRDITSMLSGDWDLTLFTCNFSGNARITVRCVRRDG